MWEAWAKPFRQTSHLHPFTAATSTNHSRANYTGSFAKCLWCLYARLPRGASGHRSAGTSVQHWVSGIRTMCTDTGYLSAERQWTEALSQRKREKKAHILQITTPELLQLMQRYYNAFSKEIQEQGAILLNRCGRPLSPHSVRRIINKYLKRIGASTHVTTICPVIHLPLRFWSPDGHTVYSIFAGLQLHLYYTNLYSYNCPAANSAVDWKISNRDYLSLIYIISP